MKRVKEKYKQSIKQSIKQFIDCWSYCWSDTPFSTFIMGVLGTASGLYNFDGGMLDVILLTLGLSLLAIFARGE